MAFLILLYHCRFCDVEEWLYQLEQTKYILRRKCYSTEFRAGGQVSFIESDETFYLDLSKDKDVIEYSRIMNSAMHKLFNEMEELQKYTKFKSCIDRKQDKKEDK
jgi:hypothetical protein